MIKIIMFCILVTASIANATAYIDLPRDANGWTVFTPSSDSRIVYVSASGNDTTGRAYVQSGGDNVTTFNHPDWSNPQDPAGTIYAFATHSAAYAKTRDDMPDWILIKRGDTFVESISARVRSGRSATEPSLIGAYGSTGLAPTFKVPPSEYAYRPIHSKRWMAISGITFYAYTRDPASPDYIDSAGVDGLYAYANEANVLQDILIEGCKFLFFSNNQISGAEFDVNILRFHLYRCVFANSYSEYTHSQGLLSGKVNGLFLEENVFDHNGWLVQSIASDNVKTGGQATWFNHNTYISDAKNLTLKNNIFLRPSSMQNKFTANEGIASAENILIENNLYVDGEGAISIGGNTTEALRFKDVMIKDNVITNLNISHPTNKHLAYGIEIHDWDGGEIKNNYIIHTNETNSWAFYLIGTSRNVSINKNTIYEFKNDNADLNLIAGRGVDVSNMAFTDNTIQVSGDAGYIIKSEYDPFGKWTFSGNKYFSNRTDGTRFTLLGANKTDAQWAAATGDNSTFEQVSFPDPTRSIETYMASLGEMATIDAFIAKARAQDRYNWDPNITSEAANAWIKAGFGMGQRRLFRNVRLADPVE